MDDYGFIDGDRGSMAAAQSGRRIIVAFQPHRFTRTASLMPELRSRAEKRRSHRADDIYGAGEDPIAGVTIHVLAESIRRSTTVPVDLVPRLDDVATAVARITRRGDVVITLGAGSISAVPDRLIELLKGASA